VHDVGDVQLPRGEVGRSGHEAAEAVHDRAARDDQGGLRIPGLIDGLAQFGDLFDTTGPARRTEGCSNVPCSMSVDGIGSILLADPGASLEIYSADAGCITGNITGLKDPIQSTAPDFNGAFFAVRCSS